ncbi:MAG: hypothetical protein K8J09_23735 [Planctomycetes bacterium]|nr:hypothetical protein [Planctomycetota bacterium]MCC7396864.1 hypothetical protein [Planctomycetota bacterium]
MRTCPTVAGAASPLITHQISCDTCLARQGSNFHKCHRCIYRGMAANWEPAAGHAPVLDVVIEAETGNRKKKTVAIPRPAKAQGKAPAKADSKKAKPAARRRPAATSE